MELVTLIGLAAVICSSFIFVPQVIKTIKTKSVKDLSLNMFVLSAVSNFLWFLYGILIEDLLIILSGGIISSLAVTMIFLIIKYNINKYLK